jgi:hypothetical protein
MLASLNEMWTTGRLLAVHPVAMKEPAATEIDRWLLSAEQVYRKQLPPHAPVVNLDWARWAVQQFFRASQLLVHRDLGEQFILTGLETDPAFLTVLPVNDLPVNDLPAHSSIHYSVDLVFRFLPDLNRLAKAASSSDPLLQQIQAWFDRWPLSGARMHLGIAPEPCLLEKLEPILYDRCLRILYIERVLGPSPTAEQVNAWSIIHAQMNRNALVG